MSFVIVVIPLFFLFVGGCSENECTKAGGSCESIGTCAGDFGDLGSHDCDSHHTVCCLPENSCTDVADSKQDAGFECCSENGDFRTVAHCDNGNWTCLDGHTPEEDGVCPLNESS